MADTPELLCVGEFDEKIQALIDQLRSQCEVSQPESLLSALEALGNSHSESVLLTALQGPLSAGALLEAGGVLDQIPDALVLLDGEARIIWHNARLSEICREGTQLQGVPFFNALKIDRILGPDFGPFQTALATGEPARTTVLVGESTYYDINTQPITPDKFDYPEVLVVVIRDVSQDVQQRQKLTAIYTAGIDLSDLTPQEIADLTFDDRVELLKSQILDSTQRILGFDTLEIRLLIHETGLLEPLLVEGMEPLAAERELYARPTGNGVTGFVAASGKSYLCEDTELDPLYITGAAQARSSLTVPLTLHDQVMGTFNVESPGTHAFNQDDLQFLETFGREIAKALNTLDLLAAENACSVNRSTERIMKEIAGPVDEILTDAAAVLEKYIGHDPDVSERLQRILRHTRGVRHLIRNIGETLAPATPYGPAPEPPARPKLRDKRVLVIDADEAIRVAAHELLERFGCIVETAQTGEQGCLMSRSFHYDAAIADIRLPDIDGFECYCKLRRIHEHMPIILMTGFGYDAKHCIVKARQQGLKAVLYKPFRLDQLLTEIENAVDPDYSPDDE